MVIMGEVLKIDGAPEGQSWLRNILSKMDGWANTVTGLGLARDKREGGAIKGTRGLTATETFVEELFHSDDIAAKIAEAPPKEMTREWIDFNVDSAKDDDDEKRVATPEQAKDTESEIMKKLDQLKAKKQLRTAMTWARVYGGSLVFLGVNDGLDPEDPNALAEPLDTKRIESFDFLTVFDRFEAQIQSTNNDAGSDNVGLPETYLVTPANQGGRGTQQPTKVIHASRFIRFDGALTARRRMQGNGGWSDSIYVKIQEVLRDFGLAWGSVAHLLQDFSQAVYGMKDLNEVIASNQSNLVLDRLALLDKCRAVSRAIPIDKDHESFERMTTSLTGLPQTLVQFALRIASAANMPVVMLMGMSPAGFSSTGESDLTFWYNEVRAMQEDILRDPIQQLIELLFASKEFAEPDSWSFDFNPLWTLDRKEESEVRKNNAQSDALMIDSDVVTPDEVAQSRFGGDKYGTEIHLDEKKRETDKVADALAAKRSLRTEPPRPMPPPVPSGNGNVPPPAPPPTSPPVEPGMAIT